MTALPVLLLARARDALVAADPACVEHLTWCAARELSRNTIRDRRYLLGRVYGDLGAPATWTAERIAGWLATPGWSAQTRATYRRHLAGFCRWAVEAGRLAVDPTAHLPAPRIPPSPPRTPVPPAVAETMLAEAPEPWRTAAIIAYFDGLRAFEIAGLDRADVSRDVIEVRGKGGRVDLLPTHPRVWEHVAPRPEGLLVSRPDGGALTAQQMSNGFADWARQTYRRTDVSLHRFRHGFCDRLRQAGVDVRVIQTLMRHASIVTTQRYMHVDESERTAAIGLL